MKNRDFETRKRSSGTLIRGFLGALGVLAVQLLPICGDWLNERSQMQGPWPELASKIVRRPAGFPYKQEALLPIESPNQTDPKAMAKVKLDLQRTDFLALRTFAQSHRDALVENANHPTPQPTVAVFDAALGDFSTKLDEISAAEVALQTLRAERNSLRVSLEANLNGRGTYIDTASGGDCQDPQRRL